MPFVWRFLVLFCVIAFRADGQRCFGLRCGDFLVNIGCVWCKDKGFISSRCGSLLQIQNNGCKDIVQRISHSVEILEDKEFSDSGPEIEAVQIRPQRIKIRLAPNLDRIPHNVLVYFKVARNIPLDLYFLSDASVSMTDFIPSIKHLDSNFGDEMSVKTDHRFGFGTAMNKILDPFTDIYILNSRKKDCDMDVRCFNSNSFIHRLSLTSNLAEFIEAFSNVTQMQPGYSDSIAGLFDGLMQVMVCGDRIGWRKGAKRMVIYLANAHFHQAGDGRIAGILEQNDGLCHLDETGKYTMAEIQDYPSVGQIIDKTRENNMNLIFVITGDEGPVIKNRYYDPLAKYLPVGIQNTSHIHINATNTLDIIHKSYQHLCKSVKLLTKGIPEEIILGIYTNCRTERVLEKTNFCEKLTYEKWVNFTLSMVSNMTVCPKQRSVNITVFPEGVEEHVHLEVDHACECDCQREPEAEPNSDRCSGRGTFECGVCHCHEGWSGEECECDQRGTEEEACGTETGICTNAGNCTCRKCDCFKGYSGLKCACNDQTCPFYNGRLCGRPGHGHCSCGQCVCTPEYTGPACECSKTVNHCMNQNGTICSNHGECRCGKCYCTVGYHGKLCDKCHVLSGSCEKHYNCVKCVGFSQGHYTGDQCKEKCPHVEVVPYMQVSKADDDVNNSWHPCVLDDEYGCLIYFNVYIREEREVVKVKDTKRKPFNEVTGCSPGPIDPLKIGLGIAGAVIVVQIVLLVIWKILTFVYDEMESRILYSNSEVKFDNENSITSIYKTISDLESDIYVNEAISPTERHSEYERIYYELLRKSTKLGDSSEFQIASARYLDPDTCIHKYEQLENVTPHTEYQEIELQRKPNKMEATKEKKKHVTFADNLYA